MTPLCCGWQDSEHRRPYEALLLAHTAPVAAPTAWPAVPDQVVIAAVPGAHSRKPHLGRLLSALVPPGVRRLEVGCGRTSSDDLATLPPTRADA